MDILALPFCRIELKAAKPSKIPQNPQTLGEHIKKKRLELGLYQADVAKIIGVTESTITNWEKGRNKPMLWLIPKIRGFLGYVPEIFPEQTLGQRIKLYRKLHGISQKDLAKQIGIDPSTLGRWERDKCPPEGVSRKRLIPFFRTLS